MKDLIKVVDPCQVGEFVGCVAVSYERTTTVPWSPSSNWIRSAGSFATRGSDSLLPAKLRLGKTHKACNVTGLMRISLE